MESLTGEKIEADKSSSRLIWMVMAGCAVIITAIVLYLLITPTPPDPLFTKLEGAIREGKEFEDLRSRIVVEPDLDCSDQRCTTESPNATGLWQMYVVGTVRNFTGKTIVGLELNAAVVDIDGKVVKDKTITAIPIRQPELQNNKTMSVGVMIDGFKKDDDRANVKWTVTGVKVQ
jgi:hypothetical protein